MFLWNTVLLHTLILQYSVIIIMVAVTSLHCELPICI